MSFSFQASQQLSTTCMIARRPDLGTCLASAAMILSRSFAAGLNYKDKVAKPACALSDLLQEC
jgi:cell division protein FtsW (lipid II flippase)